MVWPLVIGAALTLYEGNKNRKAKKSADKSNGATAIQLAALQAQQAAQAQAAQRQTLLIVGGIGAAALVAVTVLRR